MRLLLDTHVFLWAFGEPSRLGPTTSRAIQAPENEVFVSAATAWEIAIKQALGRLQFPLAEFRRQIDAMGLAPLPISLDHALTAGALPRRHDDPFDRMLIAQTQLEGLTLVSTDAVMPRYEVPLLDAAS